MVNSNITNVNLATPALDLELESRSNKFYFVTQYDNGKQTFVMQVDPSLPRVQDLQALQLSSKTQIVLGSLFSESE